MKPNIFFIIIDALTADRCNKKNKTSVTPNLHSLINNGINFENSYSCSDGTPVSLGSIFTGQYPFKAGFRGGVWHYKLHKENTTFIKKIKEFGYNVFSTIPQVTSIEEISKDFGDANKIYPTTYRLHDGLGEDILNFLDEIKYKSPWMYYLHLMDIHKPIIVPKEFDKDEYGKDEYDRMLSSIDFWLGEFLKKINLKETIVIITADHGDYIPIIERNGKRISFENKAANKTALKMAKHIPLFLWTLRTKLFVIFRKIINKFKILKMRNLNLTTYEKRAIMRSRSDKKKTLFDELFHIPLIFSGYDLPKQKNIKKQVRSIDIFPTITEIIKLKYDEKIHGKSLLENFQQESPNEESAYLESGINEKKTDEGAIGIRTSSYKYFRNYMSTENNVNLYDLKNDPYEENNIAKNNKKLVEKFEKMINDLMQEKIERKVTEITSDEQKKVEEELKKLGYI